MNLTHNVLIDSPPIECYKLKIVSVYLITVMIASAVVNLTLLVSLVCNRDMCKNSLNVLIVALCVLNLIGTFGEFPFVIVSNYNCRWMFKRIGCVSTAFIMYFVGCCSLYLMAFISFERFFIIHRRAISTVMKLRTAFLIILTSVSLALIWCVLPLVGWSYYSLEGVLTSCSVEWRERSLNVISYNISILVFVFIVPFGLILISNILLMKRIRNLPQLKVYVGRVQNNQRQINAMRKVTISTIVLIIVYLLCWLPYGVVSMYSAFFDTANFSPFFATVPSMFAKLSMALSPTFYLCVNHNIRRKISIRLFRQNRNRNRNRSESFSFSRKKTFQTMNYRKSLANN